MSELNFPKNPAVGQEYTFNSLLYMFDGVKWVTKGAGYNPVQDLYEMLASDAGASFVGANGHDNVQAALDANADFVSRFDREALRRSYAEAGYNLVDGSFEAGGTLVKASDVLLQERTGKAFSGPAGTVAPGTDPTAVGSGYVPRTDVVLRAELAATGGAGMIGTHTGESQADVNARLEFGIASASGNGVVTDFGYWSLSSNNTTPASGEASFASGYIATSTSVVLHQTDKTGRDMDAIIGLLPVGTPITIVSKISSAKRTVIRVTSVSTTATTATINYTLISHTGTNVAVGEEYKFILPLPASAVGFLMPAPTTGGPYVQNGGLWEKIKSYELGRAMLTKSGTAFKLVINSDNSFTVSWAQLRLYMGAAGVTSVADVTDVNVPVGNVLYIDMMQSSPYPVVSAAIRDVIQDAVLGTKIVLIGNYIAGYAFGELAERLLSAHSNKATRRIVSGAVTSAVLSGADYTITTGIGRSYIEGNNGAHEYEIAPIVDAVIKPGQGLVVDFTNGIKNGSNQYVPVVEFIASNTTKGWMTGDKYILFGTTGKSGATFGEYRQAVASSAAEDASTIIVQKSTATYMNIIMKTTRNGSDRYVRFHMGRMLNTESRSDVWRINTVHEVIRSSDFGFATGTELCSSGEFECAIKETGKSDYMGGWRHGDDQAVEVTILVDGAILDTAFVGNFKCSRFEIIQKSELLEVDNPTRTVRGTAYRRWVYENGELELFNHFVAASAFNIKITFFNMFPIHRMGTDGTTQITDKAFRSPMYAPEDVSAVGFPITYTKSNIIKYSGPNGWAAEIEVVEGWDKPNRNTWIQNTEEYNKGYFDYTGDNYPVVAGDTLSGRAIYRIFNNN